MVEDSPLQIGEIVKVVVFTNEEMIYYRASGHAYRTHHLAMEEHSEKMIFY
jgi:hypothetical protein